eukprot:7391543-Prymnesium_polylepis.1
MALGLRARGRMDAVGLKLRRVVRLHRNCELVQLMQLLSGSQLAYGCCHRRLGLSNSSGSGASSLIALCQSHKGCEGEGDAPQVEYDGILLTVPIGAWYDDLRWRLDDDLWRRWGGGGGDDAHIQPRVARCDNPQRRQLRGCCPSAREGGLAGSSTDGPSIDSCSHSRTPLVIIDQPARLPAPAHTANVRHPPADLAASIEGLRHELSAGPTMGHKLHRVAGLCWLAVVCLALLVLVPQHLLPSLPDELVVAVVHRALVALEDQVVAASRALASVEEVASVGTVALAARPRVALERLLTCDRLLCELSAAARQKRRKQGILRSAHGSVALNAELGCSENLCSSFCGIVARRSRRFRVFGLLCRPCGHLRVRSMRSPYLCVCPPRNGLGCGACGSRLSRRGRHGLR